MPDQTVYLNNVPVTKAQLLEKLKEVEELEQADAKKPAPYRRIRSIGSNGSWIQYMLDPEDIRATAKNLAKDPDNYIPVLFSDGSVGAFRMDEYEVVPGKTYEVQTHE